MKKKILILGGCGYTGTHLVEYLLNKNYSVTVIDTQWFGCFLKKNKDLTIVKSDIRNIKDIYFKKVFAVIHLANIANDPAAELKETLSWNINVFALKKLIEQSIKFKVKKFIYASSGSVYGVKKEKKVTEKLSLEPISIYNKTKMIAERILLSYKNKLKIFLIRPATVCGFSKKMRLDVSVNMFTYQAMTKKKMTIYGGTQIRPNIHIKDLTRVYFHFLKKNLPVGTYNAGFENLKIIDIAKIIQKKIPSKISKTKSNDIRSYRLDSTKLKKTGFKPLYGVRDAIEDIVDEHKKIKIKNKKIFYSIKRIKELYN